MRNKGSGRQRGQGGAKQNLGWSQHVIFSKARAKNSVSAPTCQADDSPEPQARQNLAVGPQSTPNLVPFA
jgi:hypothetical protein